MNSTTFLLQISAGKYFLKNSAMNISQVIAIPPAPNLSLAFFHH
ncbi:hypothetical protein A2U01_0119248, partial [Trifolium medium]|nr:hypothetical protein [Trifolium medium]